MSIRTQHIKSILIKEKKVPQEASFWLEASTEGRAFHCFNCGRFQFYIQHRIIAVVQADMTQVLLTPPISPQCQKCGCVFHLHIL